MTRIERLLTLEMSDEPGQGRPREAGRIVRGRCVMGDRPDFGIDVSVRCVLASEAGRLLDTARLLALHPLEGLAPVVDLATHDLDAFVAYRWVEGQSLAQLVAASAVTNAKAQALIANVGRILERMARGPLRDLAAPSVLALEQIFVTPEDEVRIVDWALPGQGNALDVNALVRGLERELLQQKASSPKSAVAKPAAVGFGFDAALGAALSAGADAEVARSPTQAAPQVAERSVPHLAWPTVSAKPVASAPPEPSAPQPSLPPPEASAPARSRAGDWLLGALGGALLAVAAMALITHLRNGGEEVATTNPARVAPVNPTMPTTATSMRIDASVPAPSVVAHAKTPHGPRPIPVAHATSALLSVGTDVPAAVYLDGEYLGDTPLTKRSVPMGTHHLKLEALEQSMRLLPQESDVTLAAGEDRKLRFGLR